MIGKTILHYKILEKLGEGGMGVVYLAEDTKLERKVAIKFLPRRIAGNAQERQRFEIEAKAAAALNHPNIATIYAIEEVDDEIFIVMEYIEGRELHDIVGANGRSPLPMDDIVNYATQIASGLQAAHEKGIVHRDIKSSNIMVTESGQVKIMDFGLAKIADSGTQLTKDHSTLGTAAYMSPEQARGEEVDGRSDIWSLGVTLYQMLTGEAPFRGEYEQAVIYCIMNEAPKPISVFRDGVPENLENIVSKCLKKEANDRYQSAKDLLEDLHQIFVREDSISAPAPATRKKNTRPFLFGGITALFLIAILGYFFSSDDAESTERIPVAVADFVNETGEPSLNSLSGMLITSLEKSRRLTVFPRSRMFDILKQMGKPEVSQIDEPLAREICHKADIHALLICNIRKFGKLYSIDIKMLDPKEGTYIWTEKEDGEGQESIPGMIDRLGEKTRRGLNENAEQIRLASQKVADVTTTNLEAYRHYFKGQEYIDKLQFREARHEFRQAIALDSTFGLAWYRLAYAMTWFRDSESLREHEKWVNDQALSLIDRIPEKEQFLLRATAAGDYPARIAVLKEMEKIYPHEKEMQVMLVDFAFHSGDYSMAAEYMEKVLAIDPTNERSLFHAAEIYSHLYKGQRDYAQKIDWLEKVANESPIVRLQTVKVATRNYVLEGLYDKAEIELKKFIAEEQPLRTKQQAYAELGRFYPYLGKYRESLKAFDEAISLALQEQDSTKLAEYHFRKAARYLYGWYDVKNAKKEMAIMQPFQYPVWAALINVYTGNYKKAELQAKADGRPGLLWMVRLLSYISSGLCGESQASIDSSRTDNPLVPLMLLYPQAVCNTDNGELDQAEKNLLKLQRIKGQVEGGYHAVYYPKSFYLLGKVYEQKGDKQRAIENTEKFLDLWKDADPDLPDLIDAKERLAKIKGE